MQSGNWRIALYTSAWNGAVTLSTRTSLTGEVAASYNYSAGGGSRGLLTQTWTAGASAGQYVFTFYPARVWTANGGTITNVKYAVIYQSASQLLVCYSQLSTTGFNITAGNTLTLTASGSGVFTMA